MKVHTINLNQPDKLKSVVNENNVGVYERGNNVNFGSGASSKAATSLVKNAAKEYKVFNNLGNSWLDKIATSKGFEKMLAFFEDNTSLMQAGVALIVAGILRPATNLAMAGKDDREDSIYAASHAIASAVIGFVVSSIVLKPFDDAFKKIKANPEKAFGEDPKFIEKLKKTFDVNNLGLRYLEKSKAYKNVSKFGQMMLDTFIMGVPKAMLTIALIPPILKYVFHMEKKPKNQANKVNTVPNFMNVSMAKFLGGEK